MVDVFDEIYLGSKKPDEGNASTVTLISTTGTWQSDATYQGVRSKFIVGADGAGLLLDITTDASSIVSVSIVDKGFGYSVDDEVKFYEPGYPDNYITIKIATTEFAYEINPSEKNHTIYLDKATGDLMCKITFDGTTKTTTLVDFSEI